MSELSSQSQARPSVPSHPKSAEALANASSQKVDFIKTQSDDYHIQTMSGAHKRNKSGAWITVLIIVLIVVFLGLGGVLVWTYRDSLGIKIGNPPVPVSQNDQSDTAPSTTDQAAPSQETPTLDNSAISTLEDRIKTLEEQIGILESKKDHEADITNIEIFLKKTDSDSDGVSDFDEIITYGSDPDNKDTDGDGFTDGEEVSSGFNPNGDGALTSRSSTEESSTKSDAAQTEKYIGAFSLTDVELSSNDVQISVGADNSVTGSFTFEYQYRPYKVDLTGTRETGSDGEMRFSLDSSMISGTDLESFSTELFLAKNDQTNALSGTIQFTGSSKDFLNNQKGEISLKLTQQSGSEKASTDAGNVQLNDTTKESTQ